MLAEIASAIFLYSSVLQAAQKMSKKVENNKDGDILSPNTEPDKPTSFKTFLYDSSTGAVLGRTGGNWGKNLKKKYQLRICDVLC
jgi:hypothetical protein